MTTLDQILSWNDKGQHVATIAKALDVSPGYVYGVLREHRPKRARKPRTRTSTTRVLVLGLHKQGIAPRRIAFLAQCTPAYVYRLLDEVKS
jgi:hypothetical protein